MTSDPNRMVWWQFAIGAGLFFMFFYGFFVAVGAFGKQAPLGTFVLGVAIAGAAITGFMLLGRAEDKAKAVAVAEKAVAVAEADAKQVRERALAAELEYAIWLNMIETGASTRVQGSALLTAVVRFNDLEHVVAHLLMADHWVNVRLTPDGADGGLDVIGDSPPRRVAAQVKHVNTPVGRPVLQQLLGAAQAGGFTDAVLASSGGFAQTVRDLAREQQSSTHLQLWDRPEIIKKIDALDAAAFKAMVSPLVPYLIGKRPA